MYNIQGKAPFARAMKSDVYIFKIFQRAYEQKSLRVTGVTDEIIGADTSLWCDFGGITSSLLRLISSVYQCGVAAGF